MIAGAIGGKPKTPTPGLVASTGSKFLSSLPKLGIVSVPNGASVIYLKSRGNLRIQAVEWSRKTVIVNEKVDDFDDKFNNGHAGQNQSQLSTVGKSTNIKWQDCSVGKFDRQRLLKQKGCVIWITGLSGSGKSTVACALSQFLHQRGKMCYILDGDNVRHGLNRDLGFKAEDRAENIRRIGEVAKLFADAGVICIASLISPYRRDRDACRALLPEGDFIEVFMDVPLQVCEARDSKGLYKLARAGKIKEMDAAKRRNLIKQQAAKKKQDGGQTKGTIPPAPPKRTPQEKTDRPQKKQKTTIDPVVALQAEKTPVKHGKGKGLMKGPAPSGEKPPVLFREDSSYALEKMSSMLTADDYADLGNHSTEAMGETGLFTLGQAMVMMKGLFGRCLNHETSMNRLRQKNKTMEDELHELKTYKINVDRKLKCSEQVRGEVEKENGHLRELLKDKERQLTESMSKLDNAKELAVQEYRDSDLLIAELGNSFADGFDDALRQVKSSYPDLDVSHVNIDAQGQTLAQSVHSESTEEVFAVNAPADEGEAQPTDGPVDGNSSPKND